MITCAFAPLSLAACAADAANPDDSPEMEASDLTGKTVKLTAGGTTTFTLNQPTSGDLTLTVDCTPPADPDDPGPVFKLAAPTFGETPSDPARAGFWSRTAAVAAGTHTLTFTNQGAPATCSVRATAVPASATCRESLSFRSPNTDHTHVLVGTTSNQASWEAFPTSGNHWGSWAKWSTVYPKAIQRGFLLHNLEHGGLVFSYKCADNSSAACKDAETKLTAIAQTIGPRTIVTPDPTQPEMFAIRAWRYGFSSSCLDDTSAKAFAHDHYRNGREDTDANPPIPFDPTTTNVPCQDLMAAPDSCPN